MYDHWNAFRVDDEIRRLAEDYATTPDRSLLLNSIHGWINTAPDKVLAMVCAVAQIAGDGATLDVLAAGPLEDLLCAHGETMLAPIRTLAHEHEIFRALVCGVWRNSMPKTLYQKVRAIGVGRL